MEIKDIMANTSDILGWAMMAAPEVHPQPSDKVAFQLDVRCGQLDRQVSELTKLIYKIVEDMQDENSSASVSVEWVNRDIRDQLVELAYENKELLEENSKLTDKINEYMQLAFDNERDLRRYKDADDHIRDIEKELNQAWNNVETLREMLADAQVDRDAFDNLEFAYNQLVPENKSLRDTYNELGKKYADLQTANQELMLENELLQETNENYADAIERLERDNKIQRKIAENQRSGYRSLDDERAELHNEINIIKEELVGVRTSVKILKKALHDASA